MAYRVWEEEDGVFAASCPIIPGCHSQGETKDESLANIRKAIKLSMKSKAEEGWKLPVEWELRSA